MTGTIRLDGTTVDAPDALALATFYAEITGGVARGSAHWAAVAGPGGTLSFQRSVDQHPSTWPAPAVPQQLHLDFLVDDLEATGARVLAAGATRMAQQPNADHCTVYADPAGHPFCLTTWRAADLFAAAGAEIPDPAEAVPERDGCAEGPAGRWLPSNP